MPKTSDAAKEPECKSAGRRLLLNQVFWAVAAIGVENSRDRYWSALIAAYDRVVTRPGAYVVPLPPVPQKSEAFPGISVTASRVSPENQDRRLQLLQWRTRWSTSRKQASLSLVTGSDRD